MARRHPGICEATAWGKRYGKNLTPQRFDDLGHNWHLAKAKNWGPWSCCGRPASSEGCQAHAAPAAGMPPSTSGRGKGAFIQFLINGRDRVRVTGEDVECWLLSSGRIAKKRTEGSSWVWAQDIEGKND